ncbi:MAG: asparaginase [Candidatus Parvarchaeota archaeon]|nr:asparaginase [Candidatus Parvarchaeota archaeon]
MKTLEEFVKILGVPLSNYILLDKDKNLKKANICWIRTGGTIDQIKDKETGRLKVATKEELNHSAFRLDELVNYDKVDDLIKPIDSSNMVPEFWEKISDYIREKSEEYDGFVISHGTDTMHYTSSALAFLLSDIEKPIIMTGSMIPLSEPGSDAIDNIRNAFITAGYSGLKGVYITFGSKIINGVNAAKISPDQLDAFRSINKRYAGFIFNNALYINKTIKYAPFEAKNKEFKGFNKNVRLIKAFPGMGPKVFYNAVDDKVDGIILSAFGSGGANTEQDSIIDGIKAAVKNKIPVFVCTQCDDGKVKLEGDNAYDVNYKLREAGAVGLGGLHEEGAIVKLMYVTGKTKIYNEIVDMMTRNMFGEED